MPVEASPRALLLAATALTAVPAARSLRLRLPPPPVTSAARPLPASPSPLTSTSDASHSIASSPVPVLLAPAPLPPAACASLRSLREALTARPAFRIRRPPCPPLAPELAPAPASEPASALAGARSLVSACTARSSADAGAADEWRRFDLRRCFRGGTAGLISPSSSPPVTSPALSSRFEAAGACSASAEVDECRWCDRLLRLLLCFDFRWRWRCFRPSAAEGASSVTPSVGADAGAGAVIGAIAAGEGAAVAAGGMSSFSSAAEPSIVSCALSMALAAGASFSRTADVTAGERSRNWWSEAAAMALRGLAATKAKMLVRGERCAKALPFLGIACLESSQQASDLRHGAHARCESRRVVTPNILTANYLF